MDRQCSKCKETKPDDCFGKSRYCRSCMKSYNKDYHLKVKGTSWRKKQTRAAQEKNKAKFPQRRKARRRLEAAVRSGRVEKLPCEVCGHVAEAHHENYDKPLEVRWLCKDHHEEVHHSR